MLVAVWTAAGQLARRRLSRFGRLETIRPLMPDASTGRRRLKFILYLTAFALLTLALARPQLGSKLREVESRGIEMMLVVDVSNSMLAEDFEPNRLERTKYAINKLFDGLKQDRVGLVVFAGDAVVQLPITSDYRMAKAFARRISSSARRRTGWPQPSTGFSESDSPPRCHRRLPPHRRTTSRRTIHPA